MKFCNKCGDPVEVNERFCNKCGNPLEENLNVEVNNNQQNKSTIKGILIGVGSAVGIILIIFVCYILIKRPSNIYYFNDDSYGNDPDLTQNNDSQTPKKGKYKTVIIYDNTYSGISINSKDDAYNLIEQDSVSQKDNCPSKIKTIENEIINKYGITAVNLCELDNSFAKEIEKVIKKIYDEYPSARGSITNLTLANASMSDSYIAAFMPAFSFATADTYSTYPWVIKTQIILNTTYFLNKERLQASVEDGSKSGHFPPNATIYSPVAHEFGHYLSFLAMMREHRLNSILMVDDQNVNDFYNLYSDFGKGDFSLKMIKEAYENYKKDKTTDLTLDEWRGTISKYALAKDNNGNYIWDETIAEAFHDVYLNDKKAKDASKYIIAVLKSKLGS